MVFEPKQTSSSLCCLLCIHVFVIRRVNPKNFYSWHVYFILHTYNYNVCTYVIWLEKYIKYNDEEKNIRWWWCIQKVQVPKLKIKYVQFNLTNSTCAFKRAGEMRAKPLLFFYKYINIFLWISNWYFCFVPFLVLFPLA